MRNATRPATLETANPSLAVSQCRGFPIGGSTTRQGGWIDASAFLVTNPVPTRASPLTIVTLEPQVAIRGVGVSFKATAQLNRQSWFLIPDS